MTSTWFPSRRMPTSKPWPRPSDATPEGSAQPRVTSKSRTRTTSNQDKAASSTPSAFGWTRLTKQPPHITSSARTASSEAHYSNKPRQRAQSPRRPHRRPGPASPGAGTRSHPASYPPRSQTLSCSSSRGNRPAPHHRAPGRVRQRSEPEMLLQPTSRSATRLPRRDAPS